MNIILLKHGKKYTAQDVNQQAVSLRKYTDYPIYCFTEDPENVIIDCIPIPNKPKLAKWWNKLHAFRQDLEIVLYMVLGASCLISISILLVLLSLH